MYTVDLVIANDWGTGFTANLVITNLSNEPMEWSQLEFDAPFTITNLWNGEILSSEGSRYVVSDADWNSTIAPGNSITIGFNGQKPSGASGELTNINLAGFGEPTGSTPPEPTPEPEPALPQITLADTTLTEGDGSNSADFQVRLSTTSDDPVTVRYETRNGSAIAGEDYSAASGTLTFAPGQTEKTISIPVLGDTQVEADETFRIRLSNPTNGELVTRTATANLTNDDVTSPSPSPSPSPTPNSEGAINFEIVDDWGNGFTANITIQNTSNQAIDGWDLSFEAPFTIQQIWNASFSQSTNGAFEFTPVGWNQSIPPGGSVTFGLVGKKGANVDPTPTHYELNGADIGTPPEPSPLPTLSISDATVTEGTDDAGAEPQAQFTVTLSEASDQAITVGYGTENGSAIANSDYTSKQGQLTFAAGETEKIIRVAIADDAQVESSETFTVELSNPVGATLDEAQGVGTILDNDNPLPNPDPNPDPNPNPNPNPGPSTGAFNYAEGL
ncbi:MAG: hypothetical protein F6K42_13800, partial [Leptolyngbya sp. SIO1D8]|nr:hypothetical protein [Leptolyngbya sp. SIO1D8]